MTTKKNAVKAPDKTTTPLIIKPEMFMYTGAGLFFYETEEEDLKAFDNEGVFLTNAARDYGIKKGHIVVCKNNKEARIIVVK